MLLICPLDSIYIKKEIWSHRARTATSRLRGLGPNHWAISQLEQLCERTSNMLFHLRLHAIASATSSGPKTDDSKNGIKLTTGRINEPDFN